MKDKKRKDFSTEKNQNFPSELNDSNYNSKKQKLSVPFDSNSNSVILSSNKKRLHSWEAESWEYDI